ncbi:MAG TPA: hypothetical protein VIY28_13720 [Pseudonocardiaceae bacterium]
MPPTSTHHPVTTFLCPVEAPLRILGGKWKLIILFYLLQRPGETASSGG